MSHRGLAALLAAAVLFPCFAHAQAQTPALDRREARQQQRIADGIQSGQLTAREATRLERREARLQHDESIAKADGVVTPQERARVHREADRDSRAIYKMKHNGAHQ